MKSHMAHTSPLKVRPWVSVERREIVSPRMIIKEGKSGHSGNVNSTDFPKEKNISYDMGRASEIIPQGFSLKSLYAIST